MNRILIEIHVALKGSIATALGNIAGVLASMRESK